MYPKPNPRFPRIITSFCRQRLAGLLPPREVERVEGYLIDCFRRGTMPPGRGGGWAWSEIASACTIDEDHLAAAKDALRPLLTALRKELKRAPRRGRRTSIRRARAAVVRSGRPEDVTSDHVSAVVDRQSPRQVEAKKRGPKPNLRVQFPEPLWLEWDEPDTFSQALDLHMRRHGDSSIDLQHAIRQPGDTLNKTTIATWRRGAKAPQSLDSMAMLKRIERRYGLPAGYFKAKLPHPARSATGHDICGIGPAERRRLAWHLPDDFDERDPAEREKILEWVRSVIITGSTEYRRYQAAALRHRYSIRFPEFGRPRAIVATGDANDEEEDDEDREDPELIHGAIAPPALAAEMAQLVKFKTSTLTAFGYQRNGVWGEETAAQNIEHLGLLFGALVASPTGPVRGYGAPLRHLSFALLVLPAVWDWYVQWREKRRGFYTSWEVNMLQVAVALTRQDTGWLRQSPQLADRLKPIRGLVSAEDVSSAKADWDGACSILNKHALARAKEVQRVARVHRDPFEPILPILESESPLGEYRKIANEIVRLMPDERRYPIATAEAIRSLLMIRLGLHLGLRQRNLRQLLICSPGRPPTSERYLVERRCGELRWSEKDSAWEVFIPAAAFKNATSSFFGNSPFRLLLPKLDGLYDLIEAYLERHRPRLLRHAHDPGTFFVKSVKTISTDAAYDQSTFYEAWRLTIQRYGIYNPYTQRGAIKGLLPHGPHNVRDVLATHILKQTGSYEQASYAIQDTPDMVAKHYGRFLPQDKASLAAQILNKVWEAA